jgi:hypothetical protein
MDLSLVRPTIRPRAHGHKAEQAFSSAAKKIGRHVDPAGPAPT